MDDIYDNFSQRKFHLNLIQYYALYDPNGDQGVIQGLRYYPRDVNTVIPNNPLLDTKINYYKPYTNPRVVLPKPRYKKKLSSTNKDNNNMINQNNIDTNINTINQKNFMNEEINGNVGNNENNKEVHSTFRRSYEKEEQVAD